MMFMEKLLSKIKGHTIRHLLIIKRSGHTLLVFIRIKSKHKENQTN